MIRYIAALALALMAVGAALLSCGASKAQDRPLTFMTIERPPFVMQDETGGWSGFSIDLMEAIATRDIALFLLSAFGLLFLPGC